ncbi:hypothetical protein HKX42_00945 [Salinisphaera sp. USBA-960]|nr:hypothetical protein [Salifodinibacter halophilus]
MPENEMLPGRLIKILLEIAADFCTQCRRMVIESGLRPRIKHRGNYNPGKQRSNPISAKAGRDANGDGLLGHMSNAMLERVYRRKPQSYHPVK